MRIANGTVVMVADGRKMLLLRNAGDGEHPNLEVERVREQDNPPTREQGTDEPGSGTGGGKGPRRGGIEPTDFHQLEEDRFAAAAADLLKTRALANDFDKLVVVAPPRTLGELRKHYHKEVEARLQGELDKDLTGHPVDQIERILAEA